MPTYLIHYYYSCDKIDMGWDQYWICFGARFPSSFSIVSMCSFAMVIVSTRSSIYCLELHSILLRESFRNHWLFLAHIRSSVAYPFFKHAWKHCKITILRSSYGGVCDRIVCLSESLISRNAWGLKAWIVSCCHNLSGSCFNSWFFTQTWQQLSKKSKSRF